jgi:hypothetical protein
MEKIMKKIMVILLLIFSFQSLYAVSSLAVEIKSDLPKDFEVMCVRFNYSQNEMILWVRDGEIINYSNYIPKLDFKKVEIGLNSEDEFVATINEGGLALRLTKDQDGRDIIMTGEYDFIHNIHCAESAEKLKEVRRKLEQSGYRFGS